MYVFVCVFVFVQSYKRIICVSNNRYHASRPLCSSRQHNFRECCFTVRRCSHSLTPSVFLYILYAAAVVSLCVFTAKYTNVFAPTNRLIILACSLAVQRRSLIENCRNITLCSVCVFFFGVVLGGRASYKMLVGQWRKHSCASTSTRPSIAHRTASGTRVSRNN